MARLAIIIWAVIYVLCCFVLTVPTVRIAMASRQIIRARLRAYGAGGRKPVKILDPISLQNQCLIYIIRFLELFPLDYLALLPAAIRQRLLENLPPADICRLEQSRFIEGLDMERIWSTQKQTMMCIREPDWLYRSRTKCNFKDDFFRRVYTIVFQTYDSVHSIFILIRCLCTPGHQGMQSRSKYQVKRYRQTNDWSFLDNNRKCPITIPNRFQQYYIPNPHEKYDLITLIPELCHYYPKALRVPLDRCTTEACSLIIRDTKLSATMFQHVKNLHFILFEPKILHTSVPVRTCHRRVAHFGRQETKHNIDLTSHFPHRIYTTVETILYPALQVLQELTIEVNSTKALGVMLEMSVPFLCGTTLSHNSTPNIMTVIAQNLTNFTLILRRPLSVTPVPLSIAHDTLLQYFSSLFSLPHFNSLHLEGIVFQDDAQAHAFGSILYAFLMSPTTNKQSLTCRSIRFEQLKSEDYKTMPLPPPVVSSQHSLQYKSLQFEYTALPQSILTWLFQASQLHLQALKLYIQPLRVLTSPSVVLPAGIENVHVQRLALHTYKHPLKWQRGRHPFTQLKSAVQCKVDPDFCKTVYSLQQILLKNTLISLDLEFNELGYSGILPHLTEGLINQATVGTLRELNLANNHLANETDQNLANLFNAIFCLPQIQELSLNIIYNGFNRHHFYIIHNSWTNKSASLKLQYLNYDFRLHVHPRRHPQYTKVGDDAKYVHEIMAMVASHTPRNRDVDEKVLGIRSLCTYSYRKAHET